MSDVAENTTTNPLRRTREAVHAGRPGKQKLLAGLSSALLLGALAAGTAAAAVKSTSFDLVRSQGSLKANCLPTAEGEVRIKSLGPVEVMDVDVKGLPPKTDFDFFVIQVPDAPFGVSWYQGDIETDKNGHGHQRFIGRFSIETFAVAPNTAPAPVVFPDPPFPDDSSNPKFNPIQMYHLGLWFNSPADAKQAGCADTVTPFNGPHNAGPQAMSTRNFPPDQGPLRRIS